MMKKTIGIILSLFLVTLLFAQEQRVFEKLTKRKLAALCVALAALSMLVFS